MKQLIICALLALFAPQLLAQPANTTPLTIGVQEEINSKILGEKRIVNIYLPQDYHDDDTTQYAVIYLLDGGMDEDFVHVAGLVQFNTFPWVNRIPKSIVVGIANVDRERDLTFPTRAAELKKKFPTTGGSAQFIAFIEKELQPYIQQHYRVSEQKTLIGESLGGLLATEILFTRPQLFNKYIIVSPSLWWDNGSLLERQPAISHTGPVPDIYLAVGKEGLTPGNPPRVMEVDANLLADKIKNLDNKNIHLYFDYLPDENHATIGHHALFNAFRVFYK